MYFIFLNTKQSSLKAITRIYRIFSLYAKLFVASVRFVFPPKNHHIILSLQKHYITMRFLLKYIKFSYLSLNINIVS